MKEKIIIVGGALLGGILLASIIVVLMASGPDVLAFAGGRRVKLEQYQGADPTGVPAELKNVSLINRGEYLARAADCEGCHTAPRGLPYAGGLAFATPLGTVFSTNITPDKTTGIGNYGDSDFLNVLHKGVRRDGARLYPAMPYASYTYMTDADAIAIKAYLFSLEPVHAPVRGDRLGFPFNQRFLMSVWSRLFNADKRYEPNVNRSAQWNRGAYLAEAMEHCGECHTPRNIFEALNNRRKFSGEVVDNWRAYNITADAGSGLGAWSDAELAQYLSTGHAHGHGTAAGPMAEAVDMSLSHLASADIASIVRYLRTVPAIEAAGPPRARATVPTTAGNLNGQAIFDRSCAGCHGSNGVSSLTPLATLTGAEAVNDPTGANVIQVIFFGEHSYKSMMPAFGHALSDSDIADVTNYVTSRFGATPSVVTPGQVGKRRQYWNKIQELASVPIMLKIAANLSPHLSPEQPILFSHQTHVAFGVTCSNCHINPELSRDLSLPPTATCMRCHEAVAKDHAAIKTLAELSASGQPIPWVRVYSWLPGVQFNHGPHLRAGVQCATCHGPVDDERATSELTAVTSMATCISCHQSQQVSVACSTCHAWPPPPPAGPPESFKRLAEIPFPRKLTDKPSP
jgi:mono/diheme cytochrome c family protein